MSHKVDLDALEKLREAATQGEWLREGNLVYTLVHHGWHKGVEEFRNRGTFRAHVQVAPGEPYAEAEHQAEQDAKYLHTALLNLPALIDELRELRELVGVLHAALKAYRFTEQTRGGTNPYTPGTNLYIAFERGTEALAAAPPEGA